MGTSKRYSSSIDQKMDARIAERIMRSGEPQSLTRAEQRRGEIPMTTDPNPSEVRAWVRYPDGPIEVTARAIAWTSRAVAITWPGPDGIEHRAWVWVGAVAQL